MDSGPQKAQRAQALTVAPREVSIRVTLKYNGNLGVLLSMDACLHLSGVSTLLIFDTNYLKSPCLGTTFSTSFGYNYNLMLGHVHHYSKAIMQPIGYKLDMACRTEVHPHEDPSMGSHTTCRDPNSNLQQDKRNYLEQLLSIFPSMGRFSQEGEMSSMLPRPLYTAIL